MSDKRPLTDPSWLPFLMWLYGYTLILAWTLLAVAFGYGKIEEKTSYGLHDVLIALSFLSGQWATWAFGLQTKRDQDRDRDRE